MNPYVYSLIIKVCTFHQFFRLNPKFLPSFMYTALFKKIMENDGPGVPTYRTLGNLLSNDIM